ncbi:MAG: imidazole glycerol phosphate synthase subunit HisH [Candidatus Omnitrophica bacterium]|nr:imidazole glycerol phosphate synthase subunit HisH [Candidatus Omnitrophota bacterium]
MRSCKKRVAIVDYGMGNLFSVQQACEHVGLEAAITSSAQAILSADGVILPGVGAFGDAMATLAQRDLIGVLRDVADSDKPFLGICLGMQLLMTESHEFGRHEGLKILEGDVVRLAETRPEDGRIVKVPQVGWNRIRQINGRPWDDSWLAGLADGTFMYFVHSFYVQPADPSLICATTRYGQTTFCSSLRRGNVLACQFHPERSGPQGLQVYANFGAALQRPVAESRVSTR